MRKFNGKMKIHLRNFTQAPEDFKISLYWWSLQISIVKWLSNFSIFTANFILISQNSSNFHNTNWLPVTCHVKQMSEICWQTVRVKAAHKNVNSCYSTEPKTMAPVDYWERAGSDQNSPTIPRIESLQVNSVKWNWWRRKALKKKMFTICCPRKVKMFFTKRQSLVILKVVGFVLVFSLYFLVLIKESMNVMENNAKSKTVSAFKVDNVSRISVGLG